MAQATTMDERVQIESPYRFAINRQNLGGIAFLLVGILMLLRVPGDIPATANTRLVFGDGVPDIFVPTQAFGIFTAVVYILSGAFAIVPFGPTRIKNALLIFCGVLIIPVALKIGRASCRARDWSSDVCSSDLECPAISPLLQTRGLCLATACRIFLSRRRPSAFSRL